MEIYHLFKRHGLTNSQRHFSSAWLGCAENYMCLRADKGPSADVLINLFQTLVREGRLMLATRVAWAVLWQKPEMRR